VGTGDGVRRNTPTHLGPGTFPTRAPRSIADLPKTTPLAEAFAKQLKTQGYRFVGPTSVYAFMQNVGVVNDRVHGCFRALDYRTTSRICAP
jgi:DNA-3-methyladenine glycosylase I